MLWLWYVGPIAVLITWFLTGLPGRHERRRARELARWRALMTPTETVRKREGYRGTKEVKVDLAGPREVSSLPGELNRILPDIGGGVPLARYELIEKLAYVVAMGPDAMSGSEYQAVLMKLERAAPRFSVRPLPIVDGKRVPNLGVQFKKDRAFMDLFLVEGADAKAIGKWLRRPLRDALREHEDVWLFVQGKAMAAVVYGPADADRMHALVACADALFAEHGDEGGPSLFFDEDAEDRGPSGEDDEEADQDGEEEEEPKAAKPKAEKPVKVPPKAGKAAVKPPEKTASGKK
ncbi:MAG: hypothetical protein IT372_38015 [Polyangiaceae bacterium]|nr:hypothetical protein [Polyangiaceae bacterium]